MIVQRAKTNVYFCGPVRFLPGNNVLTKEQVDTIENDPHLKAEFDDQIDNGAMKIMSKRIRATEYPYEQFTVRRLVKVVQDLYDVSMLRQIKERDDRSGVRNAVEKQLKIIAEAGVDRNKSDGE